MRPGNRLPRLDAMQHGDVLLGLASSGVHSNGFSLVRRILARENLAYSAPAPWVSSTSATTVGESLLTPTRIYVRSVLKALPHLKGLAHITGGGLTENVPRTLPPHLAAEIDVQAWDLPAVFKWLKKAGNVQAAEMARTFNTASAWSASSPPPTLTKSHRRYATRARPSTRSESSSDGHKAAKGAC
ncbi:hypothetical protein E0Z10_g5223 [Xylaria hypoxylon]|uniref:phosphoribosylformylglycinamidine cyclo-ligase n=1 Tax=Xylaria hypoxylon TaxID=37992 RepID=A0A4Z0YYG7_9PEZI|nr:hypothetical protein E0Z10_g5223 [Xylaria hypoxylon]